MVTTQAWEWSNNPEYCSGLRMAEFEELLLRAGYSKKVAHKAAMKHGWDRLQAGMQT